MYIEVLTGRDAGSPRGFDARPAPPRSPAPPPAPPLPPRNVTVLAVLPMIHRRPPIRTKLNSRAPMPRPISRTAIATATRITSSAEPVIRRRAARDGGRRRALMTERVAAGTGVPRRSAPSTAQSRDGKGAEAEQQQGRGLRDRCIRRNDIAGRDQMRTKE